MYKNEKGITLVELLAVLVISLFVAGILYSVLMLALNYNKVETTKTNLQQEANYIVTELQRIHREYPSYILLVNQNRVSVTLYDENGWYDEVRVISDKYSYQLEGVPTVAYQVRPSGGQPRRYGAIPKVEEHDNQDGDLHLNDFIVRDEATGLEVELTTVLTRYYKKGEDPNENN